MMQTAWPSLKQVTSCEDVETCLRWNRFLPSPTREPQYEIIVAVVKRLGELRIRDNDAYVRASKSLGWD
jgi:hypothetical protein